MAFWQQRFSQRNVEDATGTAAKADANITAAASGVVVSVMTGSLTTFREAGNGVDSLGVHLQVERSTVLVDDATEAAEFIESNHGVEWLRAPLEVRPHRSRNGYEVAVIIRALSPHTLRSSPTRVRLNFRGRFSELELASAILDISVNFTVRWSNPLWGLRRLRIRMAASTLSDPRQAARLYTIFSKVLTLLWQSMTKAFRTYE